MTRPDDNAARPGWRHLAGTTLAQVERLGRRATHAAHRALDVTGPAHAEPEPVAPVTAPRARPEVLQSIYDWKPDIDTLPGRRPASFPELTDPAFWAAYEAAKPFSMLQITGFFNIYQSMHHVARNRIPGDLVECGCFLGGSSIFIALVRAQLGMDDRALHVFDTFAGFPDGSVDKHFGKEVHGPRYRSFFESVVANFEGTCGTEGVQFVRGPVEDTLPSAGLSTLALVRLDTDYYPSMAAEMAHLYPRLSPGGVLIVDDYFGYEGSFTATNEYLATLDDAPLLLRVDRGAACGVKP